jgi:hypothetical protein
MKLIKTADCQVQEFLGRIPEYVIFSHTWSEDEVTLQDLRSGNGPGKKGYANIVGCCKKAAEDEYENCWADTFCINKASSAELSEAINSIYQWYRNSGVLYAYLGDVDHESISEFRKSRWLTRG